MKRKIRSLISAVLCFCLISALPASAVGLERQAEARGPIELTDWIYSGTRYKSTLLDDFTKIGVSLALMGIMGQFQTESGKYGTVTTKPNAGQISNIAANLIWMDVHFAYVKADVYYQYFKDSGTPVYQKLVYTYYYDSAFTKVNGEPVITLVTLIGESRIGGETGPSAT